jgi:hypothetical protein
MKELVFEIYDNGACEGIGWTVSDGFEEGLTWIEILELVEDKHLDKRFTWTIYFEEPA